MVVGVWWGTFTTIEHEWHTQHLECESAVLTLHGLHLQAMLYLVCRHQPDRVVRELRYLELHGARPAGVEVPVAVVPAMLACLVGRPLAPVATMVDGWDGRPGQRVRFVGARRFEPLAPEIPDCLLPL